MSLILILGSNLSYSDWLCYGLLLLVLLLSGSSVGSLLITVIRALRGDMGSIATAVPTVTPKIAPTVTEAVLSTGKRASKALLFVLVGWALAYYQFHSDRYTYTDVLVVGRQDGNHFQLQPARMQPWNATVCGKAVDWQVGEKMKFLQYQQHSGCKDVGVAGAYIFYTDYQGNRLKYLEEIANAGN